MPPPPRVSGADASTATRTPGSRTAPARSPTARTTDTRSAPRRATPSPPAPASAAPSAATGCSPSASSRSRDTPAASPPGRSDARCAGTPGTAPRAAPPSESREEHSWTPTLPVLSMSGKRRLTMSGCTLPTISGLVPRDAQSSRTPRLRPRPVRRPGVPLAHPSPRPAPSPASPRRRLVRAVPDRRVLGAVLHCGRLPGEAASGQGHLRRAALRTAHRESRLRRHPGDLPRQLQRHVLRLRVRRPGPRSPDPSGLLRTPLVAAHRFFGAFSFSAPFAYSSSCFSLIPVCVFCPARFRASSAPMNFRCFSLVAGMLPPRPVRLQPHRVPVLRERVGHLAHHPRRRLEPPLLQLPRSPHPHHHLAVDHLRLQVHHHPVPIRAILVGPEPHPPEAVEARTVERTILIDAAPDADRAVLAPLVVPRRHRRHLEHEAAHRAAPARPLRLPLQKPRLERRHPPANVSPGSAGPSFTSSNVAAARITRPRLSASRGSSARVTASTAFAILSVCRARRRFPFRSSASMPPPATRVPTHSPARIDTPRALSD